MAARLIALAAAAAASCVSGSFLQPKAVSLRQAAPRQAGVFCRMYEVCKCVASWNDTTTSCQPGSCTYGPAAPRICCPKGGRFCDGPGCTGGVQKWKNCEWANFNQPDGFDAPGQGLFVEVPAALQAQGSGHGLVVLSDVDDTMKCSGGPPAGSDRECGGTSKGGMYPGMAAFALALARGAEDGPAPRRVIPLSARPSKLKALAGLGEASTVSVAFRDAAAAAGIGDWTLDAHNAMYGAIRDFSDFKRLVGFKEMDLTRFDKLGYRKYDSWRQSSSLLGAPCAFIGDNGQGDAVAAQMMLKRSGGLADGQGALRVAFIHDVLRRCRSPSCREAWAAHGIYLFEHYPDAAGVAAQHNFISQESCRAVCAAAPMWPCSCP